VLAALEWSSESRDGGIESIDDERELLEAQERERRAYISPSADGTERRHRIISGTDRTVKISSPPTACSPLHPSPSKHAYTENPVMDPPQSLASTVSALQASLGALHPQLNVLTASLAASSTEGLATTQSHLADAASILHRLLAFLNTSSRRGSVPSPARENGELQFLLAHLFGAFALAEGEALAVTQASEAALSSIASFQTSQVSPLLRDFSSAKERALVLVAQATTKVAVANENKMHMELKLQGNRESVEATSKHLDEVQARLNTMACSMETLVEKKRELEERKLEAKEKRELQRVCPPDPLLQRDTGVFG